MKTRPQILADYYFVDYNGAWVAMYKSIRSCLAYIKRKGLRDDEDNCLSIADSLGNRYSWIDGKPIED